jgi:hypothetical protein
MLALIGLVVVVFFGVGWYRGWYAFEMAPGANGKQRIQLDVDTNRIADDAKTAKQRIGQLAADAPAPATDATAKSLVPTATTPADPGPMLPSAQAPGGSKALSIPANIPPAEVKIGGFRFQVSPADSGAK